MKKYLLLLSMLGGLCSFAHASEVYTLDPTHSYVEFHINHFGYSNPSGKWFANGTFNLDKNKLENSSANINIQVADMVTGIPKLDEHLKSEAFFEVSKYPMATFVSTNVTPVGTNKFNLKGTLTLHGVSKPVTILVTQNKVEISPITKLKTAGFSGVTTIKRSEYGMPGYIPALGDEVKLNIEVEGQIRSK